MTVTVSETPAGARTTSIGLPPGDGDRLPRLGEAAGAHDQHRLASPADAIVNRPSAPVAVWRSAPDAGRSTTTAAATARPEGSCTVPLRVFSTGAAAGA